MCFAPVTCPAWELSMTLDQAAALSFVSNLSRLNLTERLRADDPVLLEQASLHLDEARGARKRGAPHGLGVLPWNDPAYPSALLAITCCKTCN